MSNDETAVPRLVAIDRRQLFLRTVDVEKLVEPEHCVRSIWELVGRLDLRLYYAQIAAVEGSAGREHTDPAGGGIWIDPSPGNSVNVTANAPSDVPTIDVPIYGTPTFNGGGGGGNNGTQQKTPTPDCFQEARAASAQEDAIVTQLPSKEDLVGAGAVAVLSRLLTKSTPTAIAISFVSTFKKQLGAAVISMFQFNGALGACVDRTTGGTVPNLPGTP
jgi:hypothetical protein